MVRQFLIRHKECAGACIQGERLSQEDHFDFDNSKPKDFLMTLADGMGGHQGGAYASHYAIKAFMNSYYVTSGSVIKRLWQALQQANYQLALQTQLAPELMGMGCTLVGVVFDGKQLEWISVGDSPLWLYSAGRLQRLNADHSMKPLLRKLVECGELTPQEATRHPDRNMLRSALTGSQIELIDYSSMPLKLSPDDRILLASDGIFSLSELEISHILQRNLSAKPLVKKLLEAVEAKQKPTQDNTTILVVKVPYEPRSIEKKKILTHWQTNLLLLLLILCIGLWIGVRFGII